VLRNQALVRLLGGEFVSSIGDWLYMVAIISAMTIRSVPPTSSAAAVPDRLREEALREIFRRFDAADVATQDNGGR